MTLNSFIDRYRRRAERGKVRYRGNRPAKLEVIAACEGGESVIWEESCTQINRFEIKLPQGWKIIRVYSSDRDKQGMLMVGSEAACERVRQISVDFSAFGVQSESSFDLGPLSRWDHE